VLLSGFLVGNLLSCATNVPFPEVDLSAPGWEVWRGQALWKPQSDKPAIAGEIVLARNNNGDVLISFAKPPVPIFNAQTSGNRWKIDFVYSQQTHTGKGSPPARFIWFQIPALLEGAAAPKGWRASVTDDTTWEIENPDSGEAIRLVLDL